jgi:hypothetical protein
MSRILIAVTHLHQAHAVEARQGRGHPARHQRHRVAGAREGPRQGGLDRAAAILRDTLSPLLQAPRA